MPTNFKIIKLNEFYSIELEDLNKCGGQHHAMHTNTHNNACNQLINKYIVLFYRFYKWARNLCQAKQCGKKSREMAMPHFNKMPIPEYLYQIVAIHVVDFHITFKVTT